MSTFNELIVSTDETDKIVAEGIEQNRKGNFKIIFKDKTGKLLNNVKTCINQIGHKFKFGANLFMLDEIPDDIKKNEIYKEKFKELFNMATLPFYWNGLEPVENETRYEIGSKKIYRRPPIDLCIKFCEENNIEPREHALCYARTFPEWLNNYSKEKVREKLNKRMQEISSRYADKIKTIEVTNELGWGKTCYWNDKDYLVNCYLDAAKYFKNNELCINDFTYKTWGESATVYDYYRLIIDKVLNAGGRIDAIGMQYHMFYSKKDLFSCTRKYFNIKQLLAIMDNYNCYNKPLEVTEITIPAYSENSEDEELQADIIEKLYSTWFSHKNMSQIIYWNLVDGYAAYAKPGDMENGENSYYGGLLRYDMTEKPSYKRLKKLIKEVWHTKLEKLSENNGEVDFRGFYGEYEIKTNFNGNEKVFKINFDKEKTEEIVLC